MKVHQLIVTVIDFYELGADGVLEQIENVRYPNDCIFPKVRDIQTRDIGEWFDEHPLNNREKCEDELKKLFGKVSSDATTL